MHQQFPDLAQSYLAKLLKRGKFKCSDAPLQRDTLLQPGELLTLPGNHSFQEQIANGSPAILHETSTTLVVNKPALLAVHAGVGHRDDNLLLRLGVTMHQRRAPYRLHAVHRLDRETSGALLLAKGKQAAGTFGRHLMNGEVHKRYLALVCGKPASEGLLTTPLQQRGKLRESTTSFRTIAGNQHYSLLELDLHSGRTHQIRRHLAAAGTPLYGDRRYGAGHPHAPHFYLHCRQLSFPCPDSEALFSVIAPLPEAFLAKLCELGLQADTALQELGPYRRIFREDLPNTRHTE